MSNLRTAAASQARGPRWWAEQSLALALLVGALGLLIYFFQRFPFEGTMLGIDWRGLWLGLRSDPPLFGNGTGLRLAPWDVLLLKPLGWLSLRASWGVLTLLTLAMFVVSVPPASSPVRRWLGVALLVISYPALRQVADGNVEALVIGGLLLVVYGYQKQNVWALGSGLLLATAKVQEVWLLSLVLAAYLLRFWPARKLLALAGLLAAVVVPTLLWLGRAWIAGALGIEQRGTVVDSSLISVLERLGAPGWLAGACWLALAVLVVGYAWRSGPAFSRQKAASLVAASLLLAPYAAGDSFVTVLAVGVIPLVIAGNPWAIALLLVADLPILISRDLLFYWSADFWAALLLCVMISPWIAYLSLSTRRSS